jgi:cytochrome c-type biogenesis protein CcmF
MTRKNAKVFPSNSILRRTARLRANLARARCEEAQLTYDLHCASLTVALDSSFMWSSFPLFGGALILAVLLAAGYTFSVAVHAGAKRSVRSLDAARLGAYGTVALIATAVLTLAYAFLSHDFRLRYVAQHSDRSMPTAYLLTALWGGQDGSILWWLFLLSIYVGVCIYWLKNKYVELQPYVIASLMVVVMFFCVLMAFPANPFATSIAGARGDGSGMNPLLQNFYMIIHPPSLYIGFVGCAIPYGFAIAALFTGRLGTEWIGAIRKWMLFAWMFLAIGNTLGMLWAYEELGWGGYWAWDPVENAAFMPWLVATAYLHSAMIQERRGLFKVWNVFLVCLTFFMTIFGTFLTRSGAIASVHSFAQSGIGTYFVYFLILIAVFSMSLILYRWPELRDLPPNKRFRWAALGAGWLVTAAVGPALWLLLGNAQMNLSLRVALFAGVIAGAVFAAVEVVYRRLTADIPRATIAPYIESFMSREFTFLLNNWALLGFLGFVLIATTFPMISEALWNEKVSVGPPYYNAWVQPLGLIIYILMGVGTLFGWKKTSESAFRRALIAPAVATGAAVVLHIAFGRALGFPAVVWGEAIYSGGLGNVLRAVNAYTPALGVAVSVFNIAVIVQEFVQLFRARLKSKAMTFHPALFLCGAIPGLVLKPVMPSMTLGIMVVACLFGVLLAVIASLVVLPATSRRRYGGYVTHFGLITMLIGFTGQSWNISRETAMSPGESYTVELSPTAKYEIKYRGPRMEVDAQKRMVFADVDVFKNGQAIGSASPAKFIYKKSMQSPTTEVAMLHTTRDDLYLVVGNINPETKLASFQIHVNPLVTWIWFGCVILILGSIVCMWPQLAEAESRAWQFARGTAGAAGAVWLGIVLALMPTQAFGLQTGAPGNASTSVHSSGTVKLDNAQEKEVFASLRCMCGTCAREPLSTCACGDADAMRAKIRKQMQEGQTREQIVTAYQADFGTEALSVPPNKGALRAIYVLPLVAIGGAGLGLVAMLRKWRGNARNQPAVAGAEGTGRGGYEDRLNDELRSLDEP